MNNDSRLGLAGLLLAIIVAEFALNMSPQWGSLVSLCLVIALVFAAYGIPRITAYRDRWHGAPSIRPTAPASAEQPMTDPLSFTRGPLTFLQVMRLPDGTDVSVLWQGGNGPHLYQMATNRHGMRVFRTTFQSGNFGFLADEGAGLPHYLPNPRIHTLVYTR